MSKIRFPFWVLGRKQGAVLLLAALFIIIFSLVLQLEINVPTVSAGSAEWPTLAANTARTSWTPEEVRGDLDVEWYKPIEAYIPPRVQIIAANNRLYVSTSAGLYTLDATTGAEEWVYPTEFPLGHSPTINNGVAYVGGLDHKIHAIDADTGQGLWTFEAEAGFETNPLVVDGKLFAGNRDGFMYAIYTEGPNTGQLAWKFQTGGPVLYSAAYNNNTVYFASNDSYAYALNANTGGLVWKSAKLPGAGFYSWWPVVYEDKVIFSGSNAYGTIIDWPGSAQMTKMELIEVYAGVGGGQLIGALGTVAGDWAPGTQTINASRIMNYLNDKPWRRTVFVLNQSNGAETTTAPVLWTGTHSGTRYPPVIGSDGVLYQQNSYRNDPSIARGHISGWVPDVPYITGVSSDVAAVDEPHAASAGGDLVYWNLCCDRQAGAFDITMPNNGFASGSLDMNREWIYYGYNLESKAPGYNTLYYSAHPNVYTKPYASFGGENGVYGFHGDVNAPIPYNGRVYMHHSNVIMSFRDLPLGSSPTALPFFTERAAPNASFSLPSNDDLIAELESEITAMLDAGHLRPGYMSHGLFDNSQANGCGDTLAEYWSNSSETIYTLLMALPHLSPSLQQSVRAYIQDEYNNYPPYQYNHIGWNTGAKRETFITPPEIVSDLPNHSAETKNFTFENNGGWQNEGVWGRNPFAYYALWQYAEEFGGANAIWSASQSAFWAEFNDQPSDTLLLNMPLIHNAYIAGYIGYLELEKLAGQPMSNNVNNELNRLLALRANNFTKDTVYLSAGTGGSQPYCRTLNIASNFMYMVPELAEYLRNNAYGQVTAALNEYERVAPYWFVTFFAGGYAENAIVPLHDAHAIFMAKALIMEETGTELAHYLDVPGFATGDLFYIQKLVATIANQVYGFSLTVDPPVALINEGDSAEYTINIEPSGGFTETVTIDLSENYPTLSISEQSRALSPPGQFTVTLTDLNSAPLSSGLWYTVPVTASGDGVQQTAEIRLLVNGKTTFLPIVRR